MELFDEVGAGRDHRSAHQKGTKNPPEKNPVLILLWDAEKPEDQNEYEDVVNRERLLNHIPGEVLKAGRTAHERIYSASEQQRQRYPDDAPRGGLSHPN